MADEEKKPIPYRNLLQQSGIVGMPMCSDGWRMPTSTDALAAAYLPSVRVEPRMTIDGRAEPMIGIGLHRLEKERYDKSLSAPGLDPAFLQYAEKGEYEFRKRGLVKYVGPEGKALCPDRYTLLPTFRAEDHASVESADRRVRDLAGKRDRDPALIYLDWEMIYLAVNDKDARIFKDPRSGTLGAHFYQARKTEDGRPELWIGRLPRERQNQTTDKDGLKEISPDQNGVIACLTADFLERLLLVVEECMVPEIELLFRQLYVKNG